jgi:tetratricopeptide (TPR) repeat protein
MRNCRTLIVAALALAVLAVCSASKSKRTSFAGNTTWGASELLEASRDAAQSSMKAKTRGEAKGMAEKGIEYAESCLMSTPEEPGCYYWRAINTGLYYKIHIIGYQKGIKRMISDCKRVIELDPKYDHAGAYRILGELYTQLPQTAGRPDSITRDLDLAEDYLRKAVRLAPEYPENHLALAEALFRQDKFAAALEQITEAKDLTPHWRTDVSYEEWRSTTFDLENKIARASK